MLRDRTSFFKNGDFLTNRCECNIVSRVLQKCVALNCVYELRENGAVTAASLKMRAAPHIFYGVCTDETAWQRIRVQSILTVPALNLREVDSHVSALPSF